MNLRIASSLVFVGSLAYACGPQTRSDASRSPVTQQGFALASIGGIAAVPTTPREKTVKSGSETLRARFDVVPNGTGVTFDFRVTNATGKNVEITFPSGQAYDFVVVDSVGREVWRWADDRLFTQSVQNKLLGKGETMTIGETWSPAAPGKYVAIAILRSSNFPIEQKVAFER